MTRAAELPDFQATTVPATLRPAWVSPFVSGCGASAPLDDLRAGGAPGSPG